jgi:virginiamycin B lyase
MTPDGVLTEFSIPARAWGIIAGRDGHIWFTTDSGRLGRATLDGEITDAPVEVWGAEDLAEGLEGNFWLPDWTEIGDDPLVRITRAGTRARFPLPGGFRFPGDLGPSAVAVAADGNIWFVMARTHQVGRMTPSGSITVFDPLAEFEIAAASDGNVWFTSKRKNAIGRLTPTGDYAEIAVPSTAALPWGIAEDLAGNIWFTENGTARIARLVLVPERASPRRTDRARPAPGGPPGPRR